MVPTEEAGRILSEIATIDVEIRELNSKRVTRLRELNDIQSLINSQLPTELLSRIFWFSTSPVSTPTLSETQHLLQLGSVCSHWRRITRSSPRLWTALNLHPKDEVSRIEDYLSLLQLYYQHVGSAGLSLYLSDWCNTLHDSSIKKIMDVIFYDYPEKLRSIHIGYADDPIPLRGRVWRYLIRYAGNASASLKFCELEELELVWNYGATRKHNQISLFPCSPSLQSLILYGDGCGGPHFENITIKLPWHQLTQFELQDTSFDFALKYSAEMINLQKLKYSPSFSTKHSQFNLVQHGDIFGNLTKLELDIFGDEGDPGNIAMRKWLYWLTVRPGQQNLFPRLQILHLCTTTITPHGLLVVLCSRRNGPVVWSDFSQEPEDLTIPQYDPNSSHWRGHTRLVEFLFQLVLSPSLMDWKESPHYPTLQGMIEEAKEVTKKEWDQPSRMSKIVFHSNAIK
jgi:hypothetical protein